MDLKYRDVLAIIGLSKNMELQWTLAPGVDEDTKQLIENNIRLFCLNESYAYHKRDLQTALRKRYLLETDGYRKSLRKMTGRGIDWSNQMIYGVSLDKTRFQEELLAKAIYDAVLGIEAKASLELSGKTQSENLQNELHGQAALPRTETRKADGGSPLRLDV